MNNRLLELDTKIRRQKYRNKPRKAGFSRAAAIYDIYAGKHLDPSIGAAIQEMNNWGAKHQNSGKLASTEFFQKVNNHLRKDNYKIPTQNLAGHLKFPRSQESNKSMTWAIRWDDIPLAVIEVITKEGTNKKQDIMQLTTVKDPSFRQKYLSAYTKTARLKPNDYIANIPEILKIKQQQEQRDANEQILHNISAEKAANDLNTAINQGFSTIKSTPIAQKIQATPTKAPLDANSMKVAKVVGTTRTRYILKDKNGNEFTLKVAKDKAKRSNTPITMAYQHISAHKKPITIKSSASPTKQQQPKKQSIPRGPSQIQPPKANHPPTFDDQEKVKTPYPISTPPSSSNQPSIITRTNPNEIELDKIWYDQDDNYIYDATVAKDVFKAVDNLANAIETPSKKIKSYTPSSAYKTTVIPDNTALPETEWFKEIMLKYHRDLRKAAWAQDDASPKPIEWKKELAYMAQAWAEELAKRPYTPKSYADSTLRHRPQSFKGAHGLWGSEPAGENIAYQGAKNTTLKAILSGALTSDWWNNEVPRYYKNGGKGDPTNAGHYTAIVWRDVQYIGAGVAAQPVKGGGFIYITVVNYYPHPGGKFHVTNVPRHCPPLVTSGKIKSEYAALEKRHREWYEKHRAPKQSTTR